MPVCSPRLPSSFFLSLLVMPCLCPAADKTRWPGIRAGVVCLRTGPGETASLNELAMPPESGNARPVHRS